MTPLYRNIAIAAALIALPAAATAAAGPDRVRALPGRIGNRVRDWYEDGTVEDNLRRLAARLDDLTDQIDVLHRDPAPRGGIGARVAAVLGVAVLVPAAIAAILAPDRVRQARDYVTSWGADQQAAIEDELASLSDRLGTLTGKLDRQRDDAFDTVTRAAKSADD